jgi:hypothetical protein
MVAVIARRTEDAGHRPLPKDVARFRAKSYVRHLDALGISPDDYDTIYQTAVRVYNAEDNKGPFGVDHLIKAAMNFKEGATKYAVFRRPERNSLVSCNVCQGSKIAYKFVNGKVVGVEKDDDGKLKRCVHCE